MDVKKRCHLTRQIICYSIIAKRKTPTRITLSVHYFFFLIVIFSHCRSNQLVYGRNEW